jgi:acyl-CoA dehydrogenase
MAWDFETTSDFQRELDWIARFVLEEIEPLEHLLGSPWDLNAPGFKQLVRPLQRVVKERRLWACHLGPELGGQGYGQVQLALMNEILGRATFAPVVFGAHAPDSGNSEILAHYGTPEQKKRYLDPLLANDVVSCFAMTEPQGGADPQVFATRAVRDGEDWVVTGQKWFASNARYAAFFIVMAVTDPDVSVYKGTTMFIVPAGTPGLKIIRNASCGDEEATHAYLEFDRVRIGADAVLGGPASAPTTRNMPI